METATGHEKFGLAYIFCPNASQLVFASLKNTCDEIWNSSNHSQVNASQRKPSQVGGQTKHKSTQVKSCDDLRFGLIRPLHTCHRGGLTAIT